MIFSEENYKFMYSALQEAEQALSEGEVPIGAVIVYNNKVIGKGYNQIERLKDATAHAEMLAITAASNHLNDWRLNECDIYVNIEPCVMCTGAILASRIRSIYFGAFDSKFGACGSIYNIAEQGKTNHIPKVYSGIYKEESLQLLRDFFHKVRIN